MDSTSLQFLRELAAATIDASRVSPGSRIDRYINTTNLTLIRPGGRDCYPAFWIRDFSMSLDCGLISADEIRSHLLFTAEHQNGPTELRLKSGGIIPPHCIPDHINFDGTSVFYPGTMSPREDQGGEPFGVLPPLDDNFEFIHIAHQLWKRTGEKLLLDRLQLAFDVPPIDASTGGMVTTTKDQRAVGFGFYDIVHLTGNLLFPSLLRYRAARELADLIPDKAEHYTKLASSLASHIPVIFSDPKANHPWLLAATETCRQPDVWGTLYALHLKLVDDSRTPGIIDACRAGTITHHAAVRHVPTNFDFSPESMWEKTAPGFPANTYQNGAYWHTPTGWLVEVVARRDASLARQIFDECIAHLSKNDFRKGAAFGAPHECITRADISQNPLYMTSVTVPLAVVANV